MQESMPNGSSNNPADELTRRAGVAARSGDIAAAIQLLTDACTKHPPYEPAFLLLLDCLCLEWFPPPEQLGTAYRLLSLAEHSFAGSENVRRAREKLENREAQIKAVEQGKKDLLRFRDLHKGERCVIIGNGPSLNTMDLSFLKHEVCFGLNRIYLAFERFDFVPQYLVSVNRFVLEQSAAELQGLPCTKFLSFEGVPFVRPDESTVVINPRSWEDLFSTDPRQGICIGSTVTYVAMQLAYWMGFRDVVLIGVDHRFSTPGTPHQLVESQGDDPNHFDPNYFGKGYKWQLPDLRNSEQMYRIADAFFRAFRGKIVDATVGGACPVFEKADYRDLFFPSGRKAAPCSPREGEALTDLPPPAQQHGNDPQGEKGKPPEESSKTAVRTIGEEGKSHLLYLDPGYLNDLGHYENYARVVHAEARRRGINLRHYVNRDTADKAIEEFHAERLFITLAGLSEHPAQRGTTAATLNAFAAKLDTILRRLPDRTDPQDPVTLFMYTSHPLYFLIIAEAINQAPYRARDIRAYASLFYIHPDFPLGLEAAGHLNLIRDVNRQLEGLDPDGRLVICADSQRTIDLYKPHISRPIRLIPIPIAFQGEVETKPTGSELGNHATIGFCGYTHPRQGYPLVRLAYEHLIQDPAYAHVEFSVRHNIHFLSVEMLPHIERFLSATERITHHIGHFTPPEYEEFLDSCDVILIPHSRIAYPVQTSGLFVDALSRGKIVVVPDNTWMADQLAHYGAGTTFPSDDPSGFLTAIRCVLDNLGEYRKRATRNIAEFKAFHCPARLFDILDVDRHAARGGSTGCSPTPLREKQTEASPTPAYVGSGSRGNDAIELLGLDLLNQHRPLVDSLYKIIDRSGTMIGWHYILDFVWILTNIAGLPKGSIVLDAGAGVGLFQFILAEMGYKIVSVDFSPRPVPPGTNIIQVHDGQNHDHEYIEHLTGGRRTDNDAQDVPILADSTEFESLLKTSGDAIIFYTANIRDMRLIRNDLVDAVVSVSALEHNIAEEAKGAVDECRRVLKPGGKILATTSASLAEDWFHEQSKGWCFCERTLKEIFRLSPAVVSNFDRSGTFMEQMKLPGNELHRRLSSFYYTSGNNGMPWGAWNPRYLPVGVAHHKHPQSQETSHA